MGGISEQALLPHMLVDLKRTLRITESKHERINDASLSRWLSLKMNELPHRPGVQSDDDYRTMIVRSLFQSIDQYVASSDNNNNNSNVYTSFTDASMALTKKRMAGDPELATLSSWDKTSTSDRASYSTSASPNSSGSGTVSTPAKRQKNIDEMPDTLKSQKHQQMLAEANMAATASARKELTRVIVTQSQLNGSVATSDKVAVRLMQDLHVTASEEILTTVKSLVTLIWTMRDKASALAHVCNDELDVSMVVNIMKRSPPCTEGDKDAYSSLTVLTKSSAALEALDTVAVTAAGQLDSIKKEDIPSEVIEPLMLACARHADVAKEVTTQLSQLTTTYAMGKDNLELLASQIATEYHTCQGQVSATTDQIGVFGATIRHELSRMTAAIAREDEALARTSVFYRSMEAPLRRTEASGRFYNSTAFSDHASGKAAAEKKKSRLEQTLVMLNDRLCFHQGLTTLCQQILEAHQVSFQNEHAALTTKQTQIQAVTDTRLMSHLTSLCRSLVTFNAHQTYKRQLATTYATTLRTEYDTHCTMFPSADKSQQDLKARLHEYTEIVVFSQTQVRAMGQRQCAFWTATVPKFPPALQQYILLTLKTEAFEKLDGALKTSLDGLWNSSGASAVSASTSAPTTGISTLAMAASSLETSQPSSTRLTDASPPSMTDASATTTTTTNHQAEPNDGELLKVGCRVSTNFLLNGRLNKMIGGHILEVMGKNLYRVQYDDGDTYNVERKMLMTDDGSPDSDRMETEEGSVAVMPPMEEGGSCTLM